MLPVSVLPLQVFCWGGCCPLQLVAGNRLPTDGAGRWFRIRPDGPLLFAVGVALGFTNNDGVSGLSAIVGYGIMTATLTVMAPVMGVEKDRYRCAGQYPGWWWRGCLGVQPLLQIQLPRVPRLLRWQAPCPIITGFVSIGLGVVLPVIWPPIGGAIGAFSDWAANRTRSGLRYLRRGWCSHPVRSAPHLERAVLLRLVPASTPPVKPYTAS